MTVTAESTTPSLDDLGIDVDKATAAFVGALEENARIFARMHKLTPREREALKACADASWHREAAAKNLGISIKTLDIHLATARDKLAGKGTLTSPALVAFYALYQLARPNK